MGELLFDKYEIIKTLGQGGFGEVFLARDIHMNKLCAVKTSDHEAGIAKEAELLKSLKHEGLPEIYDIRETGDRDYLMMEYVDGITLRSYLSRYGKVPLPKALGYFRELLDIMEYLHTHKPEIIYRDLKPSNIMITGDDHVKLIDLGAAQIRDYSPGEEREGMGTGGYSAPELFRGKRAEPSADIYSLGAVLHEMLSLDVPKHGFIVRRPLRQYDRKIPGSIERIVDKCLREDPGERYRSVADLRQDVTHRKKLGSAGEIMGMIRRTAIPLAYATSLVALVHAFLSPAEHGIAEHFKIPVLLFAVSVLLHLCLRRRHPERRYECRIEKDIFLTDKKNVGLVSGLILVLVTVGCVFSLVSPGAMKVQAKDASMKLWVEMRDTRERKLLLKDDGVYRVEDKIRFEIPASVLPDERLTIRIIAETAGGKNYESRAFLVEK